MPLPFEHPPFPDDETLQGFVARTARFYETDIVEYCHMVGIPITDLAAGRGRAVERVAAMTGIDASTLAHRAFVLGRQSLSAYRGQAFQRLGLGRVKMRVCPACLREDVEGSPIHPEVAAYVRGHWFVRAVRTCPRHHLALVPIASGVGTRKRYGPYDSATRLASVLGSLGPLEEGAARRRPSDFEAYVLGRIGGAVGPALLDAMPLHAAMRTCEVVGAVSLHGAKVRPGTLDDDDWRVAAAVGFDVASSGSGADGLKALVAALKGDHRPGRSQNGKTRDVLGVLYVWLRKTGADADYAPIRSAVREHVLDVMPVDVGSDLFGEPVERRRVHSAATACFNGRQASRRLARELTAAGILAGRLDADRHRLVGASAERVDALLAALSAGLSRAEAAERLSVTLAQFQRLVDAGLVRPIVPKERSTTCQLRFAVEGLEDFLSRLEGDVVGGDAPLGAVPIAEASRLTNRSMASIVGLLLRRRPSTLSRRPGTSGYPSLLVDAAEVERLLDEEGKAKLRFKEAAKLLRVIVMTPGRLAEAGYLQVHAETGTRSHKVTRFLTAESVAAFSSEMVSLAEVCQETGVHNNPMMRLLEARGVTPAIPSALVLANFYRRREVEAAKPEEGWA